MGYTGKQAGEPPFRQGHMRGDQGTVHRPVGNSRPGTLRKAFQVGQSEAPLKNKGDKTHICFQPRLQPFLGQLPHAFQTRTYDGWRPAFHTFHHRGFGFTQRDHQLQRRPPNLLLFIVFGDFSISLVALLHGLARREGERGARGGERLCHGRCGSRVGGGHNQGSQE